MEVALKGRDKFLNEDNLVGSLCHGRYSRGDSDTDQFIQSICKSVQAHGCEKLCRFSSVPFITFKRNLFNVLFYNGGVRFSLLNSLKFFLKLSKMAISYLNVHIMICM